MMTDQESALSPYEYIWDKGTYVMLCYVDLLSRIWKNLSILSYFFTCFNVLSPNIFLHVFKSNW